MLELRKSVELVKCNILVLGDFNLPKLTWAENIPSVKSDCSCTPTYEAFFDILNDFGLTQMVTKPIWHDNILDLFLTRNTTL